MSAFIVSPATMHRAVAAMDAGRNQCCEALDLLGRQLYALNAEAVRQRYGDRADLSPLPEEYCWKITFWTLKESELQYKMRLYKALRCLIYQCGEGNVPETMLYKAMEERAHMMADEIIGLLPEWKAATWD